MATMGVNYSGRDEKVKYESVRLYYNHTRDQKIFDTGDFPQDWYDCVKFIVNDIKEGMTHSSDVDHFIMDGAPYDSAYLVHQGDDVWELEYEYNPGKIEFFVEKGTRPTWKEMKEMYGAKTTENVNGN